MCLRLKSDSLRCLREWALTVDNQHGDEIIQDIGMYHGYPEYMDSPILIMDCPGF